MATTNLYHCDQCGETSSTPTTGWTCDHYWQQIDLVERFRTWRADNPRGIFATTVDILCVSDYQPTFTLTTRCDAHIIAALDGMSDPPCGVIRFRASAGWCDQCDDESHSTRNGEFERNLDTLHEHAEGDDELAWWNRHDDYNEERGY